MKFTIVESFNDDIVLLDQKITSKLTAHGDGSANKGKGRAPAIYNKVNIPNNSVVLDYGCGEYTTSERVKELLGDSVIYCGYDKYNRTKEENAMAIEAVKSNGGADVAICSNVLNVINDRNIRVNEVIKNIFTL